MRLMSVHVICFQFRRKACELADRAGWGPLEQTPSRLRPGTPQSSGLLFSGPTAHGGWFICAPNQPSRRKCVRTEHLAAAGLSSRGGARRSRSPARLAAGLATQAELPPPLWSRLAQASRNVSCWPVMVRGYCRSRASCCVLVGVPPLRPQLWPVVPTQHIATIVPPASAMSLGRRHRGLYAPSYDIPRHAFGRLRCGPLRRLLDVALKTNSNLAPKFHQGRDRSTDQVCTERQRSTARVAVTRTAAAVDAEASPTRQSGPTWL